MKKNIYNRSKKNQLCKALLSLFLFLAAFWLLLKFCGRMCQFPVKTFRTNRALLNTTGSPILQDEAIEPLWQLRFRIRVNLLMKL